MSNTRTMPTEKRHIQLVVEEADPISRPKKTSHNNVSAGN